MSNKLLLAALDYAGRGWAVFPCKPKDKKPIHKGGFHNATTDTAQIKAWWTQYPDANIGIATGKASGGLVVVDIDIDDDKGINGLDVWHEYQESAGDISETITAITGRGGYHFYYHSSEAVKSHNGLYQGVDIKADGSYIMAPPSIHPNGNIYDYEGGYSPDEIGIKEIDDTVRGFISGGIKEKRKQEQKEVFKSPERIESGARVNTLFKLAASLKDKGLSNESIRAAVISENKKCDIPLTADELEKEVFPALDRGYIPKHPYIATTENGIIKPVKDLSLEVTCLEDVTEREIDWLIPGFIPRNSLTTLGGAGGIGKSFCWCAIAAAISSGKKPFLLGIPDEWYNEKPEKVMFFSAEDDAETVLRKRIRENGGTLDNIFFIGIEDTERFSEVKFNSEFLHRLIEVHKPTFCVFDPIQAFIPPEMKMAERNAMRSCMNYLVGLAKQYGTTFLIVSHTNKRSGVSGRQRLADSSDLWDISRSVLMAGISASGERYISNEKSNYGDGLASGVIYKIENGIVSFVRTTTLKDSDFVNEEMHSGGKDTTAKDEAKDFILEALQDGEMKVSELDSTARAMGISSNALKTAKSELNKSSLIEYRKEGTSGKGKGVQVYVRLKEIKL